MNISCTNSIAYVTTDLSPERRNSRLHKCEYTGKEIKRNNVPSTHDDDLMFITSSPDESSENGPIKLWWTLEFRDRRQTLLKGPQNIDKRDLALMFVHFISRRGPYI